MKAPKLRRSFQLIIPALFALCLLVYSLPPIHQRLEWRIAALQTRIRYAINPPDQIVLAPQQQVEIIVQATMGAIATQNAHDAAVTLASAPATTLEPGPTFTTSPSPTPVSTSTPIPSQVTRAGIRHEYQSFNNCGPANLSMALSYYGWQGDQRNTRAVLRPNEDDANVMPEEMLDFVLNHTEFRAILRHGGTPELLKSLIAAGFPVLLEIGHHPSNDWWMGHYIVVNGYDDVREIWLTQDSLIMPDFPRPYAEMVEFWRDFNYVYLVIYQQGDEGSIAEILGDDWSPQANLVRALEMAAVEIPLLQERALFFGLYNQASLMTALGDYQAAAAIFDLAFAHYQTLEEKQRPWRVLWYRVDAYRAYFEVGRYQSIIDLANATLSMLNKRGLEETHYWRGRAYESLGQLELARTDYEIALQLRPTYQEALQALQRLQN